MQINGIEISIKHNHGKYAASFSLDIGTEDKRDVEEFEVDPQSSVEDALAFVLSSIRRQQSITMPLSKHLDFIQNPLLTFDLRYEFIHPVGIPHR